MATNESLERLLRYTINQNVKILPFEKGMKKVKIMKTRNVIVMNTAPEFIKQGHFIVIIKHSKNEIIIFDPLASEYTDLLLQPLFKNFNTLFINKKQIQSNESEFCSLFCASFLIAFYNHKNIDDYFNQFSRNLKLNDMYVIKYLFNELENIT